MAAKNQALAIAPDEMREAEQHKTPELHELGALRDKHMLGRTIFAGVCSAKNWKSGKAITEEEFLKAVAEFTGASMSGPNSQKSEAKKQC